jgi:hypothetical protein
MVERFATDMPASSVPGETGVLQQRAPSHPRRHYYVRLFYLHAAFALCMALGFNLFRGLPPRPEVLKGIGGFLIVLSAPSFLVMPFVNAFALLTAKGSRRQLLAYLLFDFVFWFFQYTALLPEVQ